MNDLKDKVYNNCINCKYSYTVGEWADNIECKIIKDINNPFLLLTGKNGKCPLWSEKLTNNGWGAK